MLFLPYFRSYENIRRISCIEKFKLNLSADVILALDQYVQRVVERLSSTILKNNSNSTPPKSRNNSGDPKGPVDPAYQQNQSYALNLSLGAVSPPYQN